MPLDNSPRQGQILTWSLPHAAAHGRLCHSPHNMHELVIAGCKVSLTVHLQQHQPHRSPSPVTHTASSGLTEVQLAESCQAGISATVTETPPGQRVVDPALQLPSHKPQPPTEGYATAGMRAGSGLAMFGPVSHSAMLCWWACRSLTRK